VRALRIRPRRRAAAPSVAWSVEQRRLAVEERRLALAAHNPEAIALAGDVLARMSEAGSRKGAALRCDRGARYRRMQLAGEKALPLEDLAAIALEGPAGAAVARAGLEAIAARLGYALLPARVTSADAERLEAAVHGLLRLALDGFLRQRRAIVE
jgi:hypothetical protein